MPLYRHSIFRVAVVLITALAGRLIPSPASAGELERVQGLWEVIELAENGKIVAPRDIKHWLPSGGQVEIIQNTIIFKSQLDGKKYAKVFSFDASQYPKQIQIYVGNKIEGWGIYEFDQGKLVICVSPPDVAPRPTELAAPAGSNRTLMVLRRPTEAQDNPLPPGSAIPRTTANQPGTPGFLPQSTPNRAPNQTPNRTPNLVNLPPPPGMSGMLLTDDQVGRMMIGSWRLKDSFGTMVSTFAADGTFQIVRETEELQNFQRIFVQAPVSTGTWIVRDGRLIATVAGPDRSGRMFTMHVRSISDKDMIFVDALGRVGAATRVR